MPPPVQWVSATFAPGTWRGPASTPQRPYRLDDLGNSGRAHGMAAACEPTARIDRLAPAGTRIAALDHRSALAFGDETERLVIHEFGARECVMDLGEAHVLRTDAGGLISEARGALGEFA